MKPKTLLAAVALMALLFSAGQALPAEITGPDKVPQHKLIDHKIAGDWESALWTIEPESADLRIVDDGKAVVWTASPGKYTLRVVLVNFTAKKIAQDKLVVTVEGQSVNPFPDPPTPEPPTPGDNPWKPSSAWKESCKPILSLRLSGSDARALAAIYGNLSKPAQLATVQTTGDLRQRLAVEGSSLGLKGKYAGLAEAVDAYLAVSVRTANVPLNKEAAGPILETLAWAIWETGRGQ